MVVVHGLSCHCDAQSVDPFTIVVMPDTQGYVESSTDYFHFVHQTRWIVTNRVAENIVFATHVGDIVQNNGAIALEWVRAARAFLRLDRAPSLPYSVALGNHDYDNSASNPSDSADTYVSFFGPDRYAEKSWYGGSSPDQRSHWQRFHAGGRVFMHLALEWQALSTANSNSAEVTAWAQSVLDAHPNTPTIITTHEYLGTSGRVLAGEEIFNALIRGNPQVFMVFGGHVLGENHRTVANDAGKPVHEILANFQNLAEGGMGYLLRIEFDEANDLIEVSTYSPSLMALKPGALSHYRLGLDFDRRLGPAGQPLPIWWSRPQSSGATPNEAVVMAGINQDSPVVKVVWDSIDRGTNSLGDWPNAVTLPPWTGGRNLVDATLTGLSEGSAYCYRFFASKGDPATESWSEGGTFTTEDFSPTPFQSYLAAFSLTDVMGLPGADSDMDLLTNMEEFSYGLDPTVSDNLALSMEEIGGGFTNGFPVSKVSFNPLRASVRFVRRIDHAAAGLSYTVQFSSDLIEWESSSAIPTVLLQDLESGYEVVEVGYPIVTGVIAQFHRMVIVLDS